MRGEQGGAAGWVSPALSRPHSSPPLQGGGLGGCPSQGTPPPPASPLSAGSAIFSPLLTLFLFPLLSRIMSLPL